MNLFPDRKSRAAIEHLRDQFNIGDADALDVAEAVCAVARRLQMDRDEARRHAARLNDECVDRDRQHAEFLLKLAEAVGVGADVNTIFDEIARARRDRQTLDELQRVIAGTFDADKALLRRLACALGMASFDPEAVVRRAAQMAPSLTKNQELQAELDRLREEID